jgi:uncharacterized membrane protein YqjE
VASSGRVEDLREHGFGDLVKELSSQVSTLVRQEVELAKAEVGEKGKQAGAGAGMFGGAGVAALLTLASLTAFAILVLQIFLPDWAAALILTVIWAAVAAVLAYKGRQTIQAMGKPVPEQTIDTLKEDVQWAKHPTKSASR